MHAGAGGVYVICPEQKKAAIEFFADGGVEKISSGTFRADVELFAPDDAYAFAELGNSLA